MKILLLDIETAPNLVHVWGLWQQNVGLPQILESGYVLCWAAKWLDEKEVMFDSIHRSTAKTMVRKVHRLLEEADAVVHYNGTKFDIPTLNKEFILQGLNPPAPYKQIDLLRVARSKFRFPSNKLDYVAKALGMGQKQKHKGHSLWIECMEGNEEAWKTMESYNKQDVALLEKVYDKLLPWISSHPNRGLYSGERNDEPAQRLACPNCGSAHNHRRGYAFSSAFKYIRYNCQKCGTWFRSKTAEKGTGRKVVAI